MKPLNIKISAFGPYKDEIEIDFKKLGENGIFLITGDTGAGKTTIFDAISYVLFGEVSGSNRPTNSIRSNFAESETETFVELEFAHKGRKYKIRRNPSYDRPKKRGDGVTTKIADAYIEYDDNVITGTKNVELKIEEILGINSKQFKQIAMLAQGEFLKILFAESKERAGILRKIFDTEIYNDIMKLLGERYKNCKEELAQIKGYFYTNTSNIKWKEYSPEISDKNLNQVDINLILEKLEEELKNNKEEQKLSNKNVDNCEKEISKTEDEIKKSQEKNTKIDEYNNIKNETDNLYKKENEINILKNKININQEIISKVLPIEENLNESKKEINLIQIEIKKIENEISHAVFNEETSDNIKKLLETIDVDIKYYNELKIQLKDILIKKDKVKQIEDCTKKHKKLSKNYEDINKIYKSSYDNYLNKEDSFFREQAGILAEKLEQDKPCPVCGSKIHPCIAKKSESVLTKEELDKLKAELKKIESEEEKIKTNIIEVKSQIDMLKREIENNDDIENYSKKLDKDYVEIEDRINKIYLKINESYKQITDKKLDIETFDFNKFREEYIEKINKEKEVLLQNRVLLEEKNKQNINMNNKINNLLCEYEKAYNSLGFKSESEVKSAKLSNETKEKIEMDIKNYYERITINETKINEIKKVLRDFDKIDITVQNNKLKELKIQMEAIKKSQLEKNSILNNNLNISNKLKENANEFSKKIDEFNNIEQLYKTASGTLPKRKRIEFEQYVQAVYFDMIIVEANKRLLEMTDSRFQLIRKENFEKSSEKIGLDLDVIDNYNGTKRDVRSLSGGEAFKAALSLALGLSDVIQSYSGGVVIETMFIDEGFGMLDLESREQAINTLNQLIDNNKLIGIISHVTELKDRIDKKIIVSKSNLGSSVKIEV